MMHMNVASSQQQVDSLLNKTANISAKFDTHERVSANSSMNMSKLNNSALQFANLKNAGLINN